MRKSKCYVLLGVFKKVRLMIGSLGKMFLFFHFLEIIARLKGRL